MLLLLVFMGAALTGCTRKRLEKIELPETTAEEAQTGALTEIVIEIETEVETETETETEIETEIETETADGISGTEGKTGDTKEETAEAGDDLRAGSCLAPGEVETAGAEHFFCQEAISDEIWRRMDGSSYRPGCPVAVEDLRYLRVLHYDYDGKIRVGELVANKSISDDLLSIFRRLFDARYPIEKMILIDEYGGDDELSSSDNNTSCFNYRMVAGTQKLSRHALGTAIDVNPVNNPYVTTNEEGAVICMPSNGSAYMDRSESFDHKIDEDDLCFRLFSEYGFTWGGSWYEPDYMHFTR